MMIGFVRELREGSDGKNLSYLFSAILGRVFTVMKAGKVACSKGYSYCPLSLNRRSFGTMAIF